MVYTSIANVSVPTPGTPVRLSSTSIAATWVLVQALDDNTGDVYVGGVNADSKQSAGVLATGKRGIVLAPGASMLFPQSTVPSPYDLKEMWLDADTADDAVSLTYLRR